MSPISIIVLAISMSMDAFAVSVGRGAAIGRPPLRETIRTGVVFGIVEAITPVIGWALGIAAASFVTAVDHWIAFTLLSGVGLHMLYAVWHGGGEPGATGGAATSITVLLATAIGTSLDAMAVGVSLAFLEVNIVVIALAIGLATFVMSSGGMLVGRIVGERFGRWAEAVAGIALIGLGATILFEHLSAA